MAKLTSKQRTKLPDSAFGLPEVRKYPLQGKSHAANAKARATQQYEEGNLSAAKRAIINAKANKILKD